MSSGNLLLWEHTVGARKGALRARFSIEPPSDADVKEGMAFLESLKPETATTTFRMVDATEGSTERSKAIVDALVGEGSRN